jgi:hypothetical protein
MFIHKKTFYTIFTKSAPGSQFSGMPALLFIPSPGTLWRGGNRNTASCQVYRRQPAHIRIFIIGISKREGTEKTQD